MMKTNEENHLLKVFVTKFQSGNRACSLFVDLVIHSNEYGEDHDYFWEAKDSIFLSEK